VILITGFAPYKDDTNASAQLIASLQRRLPDTLAPLKDDLVFEVIACDETSRETEHRTLEAGLWKLLETHRPNLCIFTGQAPMRNMITIERVAINSFMQQIIDPARPVAYWADLPGIEELPGMLELQNIPASHSWYGGQHLCNHILYSSRHFAVEKRLPHKSGFVHIPVTPEQAARKFRDSPYMPTSMAVDALAAIISHVANCS
jgi:pyroglutamyl-peptidase